MSKRILVLVNVFIAYCSTRARDWICQLVLVALMVVSTLTTGCASSMAPLPPGIPKAKVRELCWTPDKSMTYFVIDPDTGQAISSESPSFYLVVAKSGFVYQYHHDAPIKNLKLLPLSVTDAWCDRIPAPPDEVQERIHSCPDEAKATSSPMSQGNLLAQSSEAKIRSPFLCDKYPRTGMTTQDAILLRNRNDAFQTGYDRAERTITALTIANAEMEEVLNKDDWTLRNWIASNPESIEAIQDRLTHELDSIEALPEYDDPELNGLAASGYEFGFANGKFEAEAKLFAIDAGWLILDIAVTEVIMGPLGGAKLAASGLKRGSKVAKAAIARLGEIPVFLPISVNGGGVFVPIGKLMGTMTARAHRRALEAAVKLPPFNMKRGAGEALHHMVGLASEHAERARKVLKKFKIGIDEGYNGVYLPASTKSPNPKGALVHSKLHTKAYYDKVNLFLESAKTQQEVIEKLQRIRETLLDGTFHNAIK